MACKRCSMCGINYPTYESRCRVCSEELNYFTDIDPNPDWQELVAAAGDIAEYNIRTPLPVPNCLRADVVEHSEKQWVPHQHLLREGYAFIEPFQVVQIDGRYYELQAHVGKSAKNLPGGAWWIEEIDPDQYDPLGNWPVLSDGEYEALRESRAA